MIRSTATQARTGSNAYLPGTGRIVEAYPMTDREKFFRVELSEPLGHRPGQFVMVSVWGVGEAPISVSCGPRDDNILEMVVRKVGRLTRVLHTLEAGDEIGIRGPYGSGFDLNDFHGRDVLFVAGGLGLVPLRSLIEPVISSPDRFGKITLISGCRDPAEELFRDELKTWSQMEGVTVVRLVDRTDNMPWKFDVGLVTDPIPKLDIDSKNTVAALCGPPVMYKFVIIALAAKKLPHDRIFIDMERRMKCGVGKCGHCQINEVYCCQEGPVFHFSDIVDLPEALK
jgi:sulfhydrogenase subunit gamma (sulfur reductase)